HLNESQRGLIAAALANLRPGRPSKVTGSRDPVSQKACSIDEAARKLDVSPKTVKRAKTVLTQGSPALIEAVKTGKTTVKAAAKQEKAQSQKHLTTKSDAAPKPVETPPIEPKTAGRTPAMLAEQAAKQALTTDPAVLRELVAVLARVGAAFATESF